MTAMDCVVVCWQFLRSCSCNKGAAPVLLDRVEVNEAASHISRPCRSWDACHNYWRLYLILSDTVTSQGEVPGDF
jgi:hypothetical protein